MDELEKRESAYGEGGYSEVVNGLQSPVTGSQLSGDQRRDKKDIMFSANAFDFSSAVNLVDQLINKAIEVRATDIHLEPQRNDMRVRYRIDGMLYEIVDIPLIFSLSVISRLKILAEMDITERRLFQDGRMSTTIAGQDYHMRVATLPTKMGEKMVIRILTESNLVKGLEELGLDAGEQRLFRRILARPHGMILVTGPIGSGKTTTLYAALNELDFRSRNIVTIEDPVEYQLKGINQVEVDLKIGVSFPTGLRAILRQDADILMIGEIRDTETGRVAVRAALSGQQIFSTLHTVDSPSAITTLMNFDIPPFLIASSMNGVIAQRLVRKICPACKVSYIPDPALLRQLGLNETGKEYLFYMGQGCERCYQTGFMGRIGIFEILWVSDRIRKLIVHRADEERIKEIAIQEEMRVLKLSGIKKIVEGVTTPEEVMREIYL